MKQISAYFILLLMLAVYSCNKNENHATAEPAAEEMTAAVTKQSADEPVATVRKLIKEGYVVFQTDHLDKTRKTIIQAVQKHRGYVSSDEEFKSPGRQSNKLVIRIPADHFDAFLGDATQGVERFESKEINVKDVTEEYLDVQARLKTKKELENRYLELLKKAQNVSEVLEVEAQIGQLRSDIESVEGRLKYLQDQVSLSTLTLTFYKSITNETGFGQAFKEGFKKGWNSFIWFFVILTNIWPFILVVAGLLFGIRAYNKKRKR